jgi:excisionase family DNA binding protein
MSYNSGLPPRTFLKPSEVASFFNVSVPTVYSWHSTGRIEGVKICGSLRIYRSSLLRTLSVPEATSNGMASIVKPYPRPEFEGE